MLVLIPSSLVLLISCAREPTKKEPLARNGVIDLSDWDFTKDGNIKLNGEWHFAWRKTNPPATINELLAQHKNKIAVPESWVNHPHPDQPSQNLSDQGFATYLLQIKTNGQLAAAEQPIGLKIGTITSAATIWLLDAQGNILLTMKKGVSAQSAIDEMPVTLPQAQGIQKTSLGELSLLIQVSNHLNSKGGMWLAPEMGHISRLNQQILNDLLTSVFLIGALTIIGLYHLVLYTQRREDRASLAFFMLSLTMATREMMTSRFFQHLSIGHSKTGFEILTVIEYLTMPLITIAMSLLVLYIVPGKFFLGRTTYVKKN